MITLNLHDLLEKTPSPNPVLFRVVHLDWENRTAELVELGAVPLRTIPVDIDEILAELDERGSLEHARSDPYWRYKKLSKFTDGAKKRINKAKLFITDLRKECGSDLFDPEVRQQKINELLPKYKITNPTAYSYLRLYWESGATWNAFAGKLANCGGKGKVRVVGEHDPKRGRPALTIVGHGMNLTDQDRQNLREGYLEFYPKKAKTKEEAFTLTLNKYYWRHGLDEKNKPIRELNPLGQRPSIYQFRAIALQVDKENPVRAAIAKYGLNWYLLNARTKKKPSARKAFGPGSVWQFDSTPLPYAFVMPGNRSKPITEVVLYLCVDVFSHLITGASLGLARGWEGFAIGLFNSCRSKKELLAEYNIEDVSWFEWPVEGLCERLVIDNAEGKGINADKLADNLNIHVTNTPPYRADLKALIEALIGYIQNELEKEEEAVRPKVRERGKSDYRLAASRTIEEFMPILVRAIRTFNHYHTFENYPLDKNLIAEDVTLTPISLWLWGLQHCNYMQPLPDLETLRINMYPEADGSIREDGIYFKKAYYDCVVPDEEDIEQVKLVTNVQNRIAQAGINRRVEKVRILYNKHGRLRTIYLNLGDGKIVECTMRQDSAYSEFAGYTFEEHQLYQNDKTARDRIITEAGRQQWLEDHQNNQAEGKVSKAATKADIDASGLSNTARLSQTRANTSEMREEERRNRADKLDNTSNSSNPTSVKPGSGKSDKKLSIPYIPRPDYSSLTEDDDNLENEASEL